MTVRRALLCFVAATGLACRAQEPLDIVKGGRLAARFVCGGTPAELLASNEYYRIIREVTGCAVDAAAQAAAPNRIEIRIEGDPDANDTIRISRDATTVRLTGNNARCAAGATYRLLEELGCRWFWADADGEYLPGARKDLSVGALDIRERAAFRYYQLTTHPVREKYRFLAHNRTNMMMGRNPLFWDWGCTGHWGGHTFGAFVPPGKGYGDFHDHFKDEPECFALWNGKRNVQQHCYTSPSTRRIFLDCMDRFWRKHEGEDIVLNLSPIDSPVHCTCENCKKVGDPSTLFFTLANDLIAETEKRHPGRLYDTYAYSFYLNPPACRIHPNLMVTYCQYDRCYKHLLGDTNCAQNAKSLKAVRAWTEKLGHTPDIYGYHYATFSWNVPLLLPIWDVCQDEIRWCRDGGIRFYKTEFYGENLASARVNRFSSYAFTKLFWNPDLDMDALMTDYTDRVFGKAGPEMKAYWQLLAKSWMASKRCLWNYENRPTGHASDLLTRDVRAKAARLFDAARAKLPEGTRERREVEKEFRYLVDWTEVFRSSEEWTAIADNPDPKRIAALKAAEPGEVLYPQPGKKGKPTGMNWQPKPVFDKDGKFTRFEYLYLGRIFGNNPYVFKDEPWLPCTWVNYQVDFDFQFPTNRYRDGYLVGTSMRWYGERFPGQDFTSLDFRLGNGGDWRVSVHKGTNPKNSGAVVTNLATGALAPFDRGWHHLSGRVADTAYVVKVDGKTVYETDTDAPVGRGMINILTGDCPLNFTNLTVRAIHAPGDPFEVGKRKGQPHLDGSGKMIWR